MAHWCSFWCLSFHAANLPLELLTIPCHVDTFYPDLILVLGACLLLPRVASHFVSKDGGWKAYFYCLLFKKGQFFCGDWQAPSIGLLCKWYWNGLSTLPPTKVQRKDISIPSTEPSLSCFLVLSDKKTSYWTSLGSPSSTITELPHGQEGLEVARD